VQDETRLDRRYCVLAANHKDGWVKVDGVADPVEVKRGQLLTGRHALHRGCYPKERKSNPCARTVWRRLQTLQKLENVSIQTSSKFSIVTVNNYELYNPQDDASVQVDVPDVSSSCPGGVQVVSTNKNEKNEKNEKKKKGAEDVDIPESLNTPAFRDAWAQWLAWRRSEKRVSVTLTAATRQLAKLARFGPEKAICSIEHSIAQDWQGLFDPDKERGNAKRRVTAGQRHPDDARDEPGTF
jgi:hypothetical protein